MVYELPKPRPSAPSVLALDPFALIDRLVVLIPPPRSHRHRYHGVPPAWHIDAEPVPEIHFDQRHGW